MLIHTLNKLPRTRANAKASLCFSAVKAVLGIDLEFPSDIGKFTPPGEGRELGAQGSGLRLPKIGGTMLNYQESLSLQHVTDPGQ